MRDLSYSGFMMDILYPTAVFPDLVCNGHNGNTTPSCLYIITHHTKRQKLLHTRPRGTSVGQKIFIFSQQKYSHKTTYSGDRIRYWFYIFSEIRIFWIWVIFTFIIKIELNFLCFYKNWLNDILFSHNFWARVSY